MKRGTTRHPKTKALARHLKVSVPHAIGILQLLWEYAAEFAPEGDVGRFPDSDIAEAVMWPQKDAARLIAGLTAPDSQWLDTDGQWRLLVHDWSDHAEDGVRKKLARHGKSFRTASRHCPDNVATASRHGPDSVEMRDGPRAHASLALPCLAKPEPNQAAPQPRQVAAAGGVSGPAELDTNTEWPQTSEALGCYFPGTEAKFIADLGFAAIRAKADVTDAQIAEAIHATWTNGQRSAGLFLTTVPRYLKGIGIRAALAPPKPKTELELRRERARAELYRETEKRTEAGHG